MIDDTARLERVAQAEKRHRQRNREVGIPDMELGERHLPHEYFAQVGYHWLLEHIGGMSEPNHDWSDEIDTEARCEQARADYLAARKADHQRVLDWLRAAEVKPRQNYDGCIIGGVLIAWPDRIPRLKTWAGNQSLAKIVKNYIAALPKTTRDVLAIEAPIKGSSGLDRGTATTALEDGFSVSELDMDRITAIGLETLPITVYPDRRLGYDAGGSRWIFEREDRNDYYGRWGTAERSRTP